MAKNENLPQIVGTVGDYVLDVLTYVEYGYDTLHAAADNGAERITRVLHRIADKIYDEIDDRRFD